MTGPFVKRIAFSLSFLFFSGSLLAAEGRLEGIVTDGSGAARLAGAIISLDGREVYTGRDGKYSFAGVEEGTYTVKASYLGAGDSEQQVTIVANQLVTADFALGASEGRLENVLVIGQVATKSASLNRERAADNLISVVSSDSIGQLPDTNVTEALQRVPGVYIERDQGEGRFVGIRGIAPDLNATTINGINVPAPESDRRAVALDVVPSDVVGSLKVTKSLTPDMDANAIGGSVDVEGLSAFDRDGQTFNIFGEASYNDLESDTSPKIGATYTNIFGPEENFGMAFSFSWFDRDFGSDNQETGGWPNDLETVDGTEFKGADEIEQRDYVITRERLGVALNFDWKVSDTTELYWRNLYSDFSDDEERTRNVLVFEDGEAISGTSTSAAWEGGSFEREMKDRYEEQSIFSTVLGGTSYLSPSVTLDYNAGYSVSDEDEPDRIDTVFLAEGLNMGYTSIGEVANLVAEEAAYDADNFEMDEVVIENNTTEDEEFSARADLTWDLSAGSYPGTLQFGAKMRDRNKTNDQQVDVYDGGFGDTFLTQFETTSPDYGLGRFGPGIDRDVLRAWVNSNVSSFERDDTDSILESSGGNFDIDEDIFAAYIMSRVEWGTSRLVYGVRYEDTEVDNRGTIAAYNDDTEELFLTSTSTSSSYDNWLPSVNYRLNITDDVVLRAAYYESLSRPGFDQMRFGGLVEIEEDDGEIVLEAEIGNPDLQPTEAENWDLTLDWYTGGVGLLSVGVFYKDLKNIIVNADVTDDFDLGEIAPGIDIDDAEVIQWINGSSGDVTGVEFNWVKYFDELPAPWNGLLASANMTYLDSSADVPGRDESIDLPLTSDTTWNLAVGYESAKLSLRLAGSYRDKRLLELGGDPEEDRYEDDHTQWDFQAKYFITEQIQLFASVINITDEPFYAYFGSPSFNSQYEEYGRTYGAGVRWSIQ